MKTYLKDFGKLTVILFAGIAIVESIFVFFGFEDSWRDVAVVSLFTAVLMAVMCVVFSAFGMSHEGFGGRGFLSKVVWSIVAFAVLWGLLDLGKFVFGRSVNIIEDVNLALVLGYIFGVYAWYASNKSATRK